MAIPIKRVFHININCSNLERSTKFYQDVIGMTLLSHTHPAPQDGSGLGLDGQVQWDAHILNDARGFEGTSIDLLEWKIPTPVGTPYREANHLGFFRLCFLVPNVDAIYERVKASGMECLSAPFTYPVQLEKDRTVRVFCARDPDGTVLEFVEQPGMEQLIHVNVNCADLKRSSAWYREVLDLELRGHSDPGPVSGEGLGLPGNVEWEAAFLFPRGQPSSFGVALLEWKNPEPTGQPYGSANHLGIYRMAFEVEDAHGCYEELERLGVQCGPPVWLDMGPEIPIEGLWALFFPDPDGTCLELIQTPALIEPSS